MSDLGADISYSPDLDPLMEARTGNRIVAEALARRLQTPRGGLFYAPAYGYDLRGMLLSGIDRSSLARIRSAVIAECLKDDRVEDADAAVTFNDRTESLSVKLAIRTAAGPFTFTLGVTSLTLEILG